jgi:Cu-Zn family superoxide dismutase
MRIVAALVVLALSGPALAQQPAPPREGVETVQATLLGPQGAPIGQIVIRGSANATVVRITVNPGGLPPGWHGVHFHSVGDCSDGGVFMNARGIVNNLVKKHGLLHPEGPAEGDLPNVYAAPDGSVNAEVSTLAIRILGQTGLKDADGSALIIRVNEDDHYSQPNGQSGARLACAVIR